MSAIFTAAMLEEAKACQPQIDLFRALFGESVVVTVARARKVSGQFDWDYASRFLDAVGQDEYDRVRALAWAEYRRVRDLAWAEYERVLAPALAEYRRARAPAGAKYKRVLATAWAEYDRVLAPAMAEYERVQAPALAEYKRVWASAWASAYIATHKRAAAPDLLALLKRIEPHIDAIVCYASTRDEHEPNKLAVDLRAALKATGV